jgi:hypothetical protein
MSVNYNFKKGIDVPVWLWEPMFPTGIGYHGASTAYDGKRYLYVVEQYGVSTAVASTSALYRFDTWSASWQFLTLITSGNQGMDIEYDSIRNVLYILHGASLTSWQVFNLNLTSVTIANVVCAAFTLTTMTPVLTTAAPLGSSFTMPSDDAVPAQVDSGAADATGQTATQVTATAATGTFGQGMVGLQLRVTSGTRSGEKSTIASVTAPTVLTLGAALTGALASGDTFVIELPEDVATGGSTTTVIDSTANWIVNQYANQDVIITSGTGVGQRRRIASNTATTLTLAAAVTGNARTGVFTTAPVAGSGFKVVPSSDFLYYQVGGATTLYKIDLAQTTGVAWTALTAAPAATGGGANTFYPAAYAPFQILAFRGAATATYYMYNIGTNVWTTPAVYASSQTFTTGASATMVTGKRKLIILKEATTQLYALDLLTGIYEPAGNLPYAAPGAYDGKRMRVITTPDGAQFLYVRRAAGPEFYRLALEWV